LPKGAANGGFARARRGGNDEEDAETFQWRYRVG
jgi:hypothetical protein